MGQLNRIVMYNAMVLTQHQLTLFQRPRQKLLQTLTLRRGQYFTGVALLLDLAFVQKHQLIRHFASKSHFVGDDEHGAAFFG